MDRIEGGYAVKLAAAGLVMGAAAIALAAVALKGSRNGGHEVRYVECPDYRSKAVAADSEEQR